LPIHWQDFTGYHEMIVQRLTRAGHRSGCI
jgi:hypothetical protein